MESFNEWLKIICNNQVILPVVISMTVAYFTMHRDSVAEEDENFIRLKEQYRDLWSKIVTEGNSLELPIESASEKMKLISFQLVEFFYMVWFLNYNKPSKYQKQWDQNMNHIFQHQLILTTFQKHAQVFDSEYQEFIRERYVDLKK